MEIGGSLESSALSERLDSWILFFGSPDDLLRCIRGGVVGNADFIIRESLFMKRFQSFGERLFAIKDRYSDGYSWRHSN
jgi:hypothetical protein